jgi:hypothetical protein
MASLLWVTPSESPVKIRLPGRFLAAPASRAIFKMTLLAFFGAIRRELPLAKMRIPLIGRDAGTIQGALRGEKCGLSQKLLKFL